MPISETIDELTELCQVPLATSLWLGTVGGDPLSLTLGRKGLPRDTDAVRSFR